MEIDGYARAAQMKQIHRIDFKEGTIAVRYTDDQDPKWAKERILDVDWRESAHVERLAHVGYHVFLLLVEHPELVETHDEILQEWVGRLLDQRPVEGHEAP